MARMNDILAKVQDIPDEIFASILSDPDQVQAIRDQYTAIIRNKNVRTESGKMRKDDIETTFNVSLVSAPDNKYEVTADRNSDRQAVNVALAYYKSRIEVTEDKNIAPIRKAVQCFGQGEDSIAWVIRICETAGIPNIRPSKQQNAEADKAQENREKRKADLPRAKRPKENKASDLKPSPETPVTSVKPITTEAPEDHSADQHEVTEIPEEFIGTPYTFSKDMKFVLYKPSEAYKKPEREAIIKNYYYADTITMFYGQAGSYKTFWAIWEGISFAIGNELCGMPIEGGAQSILYVSLEMSAKDIADRITAMTKDMTEAERATIDKNFTIISAEDNAHMKASNADFLEALKSLCKDKHYDTIYIDSFADYIAGFDVRSENDMTSVIDAIRTFSLEYHVSFRIIHHGTKPTQDSNGSMAGIHTIRDLVDYVYLIKVNADKEITISSKMTTDRSAKSRYGEALEFTMKFISGEGSFSFKTIQSTETSSYIERLSNMLAVIEECQGISTGDLRTKLGNPKDLTKMIDNAVKAGSIIVNTERSTSGSPKKCHYTPDYWNELHK